MKTIRVSDEILPAPPTVDELWWVAVENARDLSVGYLVLADPGDDGLRTLTETMNNAGVAVLEAVSARNLKKALETNEDMPTLVIRLSGEGLCLLIMHNLLSASCLIRWKRCLCLAGCCRFHVLEFQDYYGCLTGQPNVSPSALPSSPPPALL